MVLFNVICAIFLVALNMAMYGIVLPSIPNICMEGMKYINANLNQFFGFLCRIGLYFSCVLLIVFAIYITVLAVSMLCVLFTGGDKK